MKKNLSFIIVLFGILAFNGCTEEEPQLYSIQDPAINFWAVPTVTNPRPSYPSDLVSTYDFGSFANFLKRGYAAFADTHTFEIAVQTQGYATTEDRKVSFKADSIESGNGLDVLFDDKYVVKSGEGTAKFSFDVKAIPVGTATTVVFTFDYNQTEFLQGMKERQFYTLKCTCSNGIPKTVNDFNLNMMFWDWFYVTLYGKSGYVKFKFMAIVMQTADFSALPQSGTAATTLQTRLNNALTEYKQLNETDPVKYPPLYNEGSETWISFP